MSKLIRREDAVAYPLSWDNYDKNNGNTRFICGVESYREWIEELPPVDAVEVVRCRECKWWRDDGYGDAYCRLIGVGCSRNRDDYCSYGERKTEDV